MTNLSPARIALADHQRQQTEADASVEDARVPVRQLQARLESARRILSDAKFVLARVVEMEAAETLRRDLDDAPANFADFTSEISAAEAQVSRTQRAIVALEREIATAEGPLRDAERTAGLLHSAMEDLVAAIMAEEADAALAALAVANEGAAHAEAKVRTLISTVVERRWLPLAERLNTKFLALPAISWTTQSYPDWRSFSAALATDARAELGTAR